MHISVFDAVPMLPAEAFSGARAGVTTAVALCVAGVALHGRRDRQAG
jgi:hypothetical protein